MSTHTATIELARPSLTSRLAVVAYGVVCYALGLAGLVWLITAMLGLVPFAVGPTLFESTAGAVAFDLALIAVFGVQHAIMARPSFKRAWARHLPAATARPTFTLLAGGLTALILFAWQPLPGHAWNLEATWQVVGLRGLAVVGWSYLLVASFVIDHFELFGLKQVWRNFTGGEEPSVPFVVRGMYRFDRHPIMTGMLIGLWVTPTMSMSQLVLALGFTAYMVVGVTLEEGTLVEHHGDDYRGYRRDVGALVPFPGKRA